jgi:ribonucleoside-diphosphate reductase alpha chain
MVEAVAPFVDAAISKTVNVPADYPFEEFSNLYLQAWLSGLKGITTYRPNDVLGAVLEADADSTPAAPQDLRHDDPDRRIVLKSTPQPALSSLRWPARPRLPGGNDARTYWVDHPKGAFALVVGHVDNGNAHAFEVLVAGDEQPRGLGAIAKTLSMDMRTGDAAWLRMKLDSLARTAGDDGFTLQLPNDERFEAPSRVAGFAKLVRLRLGELGAMTGGDHSPMIEALIARKEPKTGTDGTMGWNVDVLNPSTGDDFMLTVKELTLPDGQQRPYSVWLAGNYPRVLDGLSKMLSIDMRVVDPAWIGEKLRKLLGFSEPRGDFLAWVPGESRQRNFPSTVAYVAALLLHRYAMLGILDADGRPQRPMGLFEALPEVAAAASSSGQVCPDCGARTLIVRDGCDFCTTCGYTGACG